MKEHEIVIIGGGLAGLTVAIHLAQEGMDVAVMEANTYPHHKVCGEYVSKEIAPYLGRLGIDLQNVGAVDIKRLQLSAVKGDLLQTNLDLGGYGISRYTLDNLLYKRAKALGVHFYFEKVVQCNFRENTFIITTNTRAYTSKLAIGAYGKRSLLDKSLKRNFSLMKHGWLAVKGHYAWNDFPSDVVGLHNFEGGYGGLSTTELGHINFCYLVHYNSFKRYKDVQEFNNQVVAQNKYLKQFLEEATPIFEQPMTIAQISFSKKEVVVDHMLMCGDTAGLIHPLCGNGMAMAVHSAKIVAELIVAYKNDSAYDRTQLEQEYIKAWSANFGKRIWMGRKLQSILMHDKWVSLGIRTIGKSPRVLNYIISKTHGKLVH
ncbi:NAD(P)/FAD-dependent oxidoreductase [Maribacter confluentis]|uniref:NAD(P)/FAD-dependent oxidoreductase n=1 Tax=Maribacter confluentis TaxID=1656093 RepID=A0ABT8RJB4_9FLAO|nr:NAD(P)/FAD-dependent oxidoreductase [Maribacter confluentis]MDO1511161.1 NAD(P)/FAD-dependent oxidoreductase [Maribacter confluentis]